MKISVKMLRKIYKTV